MSFDPDWGAVTLNSIDLEAPGRNSQNSWVLTRGAPKRHKNKVRPGTDGEKGSRLYKRPRTVDLDVFLTGTHTYAGDAADDPVEAVEEHIRYLTEQILDDPGDSQGRVPVVVTTKSDGLTHEGLVQVLDMDTQAGIGARIVTFEILILAGALGIVVAEGS